MKVMKCLFNFLLSLIICNILCLSCKKDDFNPSPSVPFNIVCNDSILHNGDSLYGRVVVNKNKMINGTVIKKIDCRLGNIVIGTSEDKFECPFGVRLKDKPIGKHTFSVIIKCEVPNYDETFWRHDYKMITIKQ